METLSQVLFWAGIISIPLSWAMWYFGPKIEIGRHAVAKIADPALREALMEAHAERWGIFVALWPVTLLLLSFLIGHHD